MKVLLDSGAFSVLTKKQTINIQDYIKYIKEHIDYIELYINLDVIGDPIGTYKNQKIMEKAGLRPMPVFHSMFEDASWLQKYIDEGYEYIGLGGISGTKFKSSQLVERFDYIFSEVICDKQGMPKIKPHGFGMTNTPIMFRYPFWSLDSTTWCYNSRCGMICLPGYVNGKYDYMKKIWKVSFSNRTNINKREGEHFNSLTKKEQQVFIDYLHMKGFQLGKSETKKVKENYVLKENESYLWGKHSGMVEVIIEPGVCNVPEERDLINAIYFIDLEKHMPKWPWAFKLKSVNTFGLI